MKRNTDKNHTITLLLLYFKSFDIWPLTPIQKNSFSRKPRFSVGKLGNLIPLNRDPTVHKWCLTLQLLVHTPLRQAKSNRLDCDIFQFIISWGQKQNQWLKYTFQFLQNLFHVPSFAIIFCQTTLNYFHQCCAKIVSCELWFQKFLRFFFLQLKLKMRHQTWTFSVWVKRFESSDDFKQDNPISPNINFGCDYSISCLYTHVQQVGSNLATIVEDHCWKTIPEQIKICNFGIKIFVQ